MDNFDEMFTFDHTVCVVNNGDYGLAFNRFTGKVLAHYGHCGREPLLVNVEEYRRNYGQWPPNEELNTALDFGYWYNDPRDDDGTYDGIMRRRYDGPELHFRRDILAEQLMDAFMPLGTNWRAHGGLRDIEIRPWRKTATGDIEECQAAQAHSWGLYGRTFAGPAWHIADVATKEQAYWLRATLAPLLVVAPPLANAFECAWQRMEALDGVRFDPEGG